MACNANSKSQNGSKLSIQQFCLATNIHKRHACIQAMLFGKASVAVPSTDSKSTTARLGQTEKATHVLFLVFFLKRLYGWCMYGHKKA